jgi:hypothetical protein
VVAGDARPIGLDPAGADGGPAGHLPDRHRLVPLHGGADSAAGNGAPLAPRRPGFERLVGSLRVGDEISHAGIQPTTPELMRRR